MTPGHAGWTLREATSADSAELAALSAVTADGGRVTFSPRHHVPVVEANRLRRPSARCVVAVTDEGIVGAGWLSFARGRVGPRARPVALLNSLAVHPQWRRRGIAAGLTRWRLSVAADEQPDAIVVAAIQAGNHASEANARAWATQTLGDLAVVPTPVARRAPTPMPGWSVRPARLDDDHEVEHIVGSLDAFSRDQLLAPPVTADEFRRWSLTRLGDQPVHRYFVVTGRDQRAVAGVGIEHEALVASLEVTQMPLPTRLASRVLGVVPRDGVLRNLNVRMAWFAPDHETAARYLWQELRWQLRAHGTTLVTAHSAESPLRHMLRTPRWAPRTSLRIVVRSAEPLPAGRVIGLVI